MNTTHRILQRLWAQWGKPDTPAEWDGLHLGGGLLSQRWWEYAWTIQACNFSADSVVVDVGAGKDAFFGHLVAPFVRRFLAVDPECIAVSHDKLEVVRGRFSGRHLSPDVTHVVCVSVLEHLAPEDRRAIGQALDAIPATIGITVEFGVARHFEHQFVLADLYAFAHEFRHHYCTDIATCPVWADNAVEGHPATAQPRWRPLGLLLRPMEGFEP